mgnify:CR=1 FL=1
MKTLNEDGLEYIDGRPVELYEIKFVNAYPMEQIDAAGISDGDEITFLVTARVETPKFISQKKSGQIRRQNAARITDINFLDPDKARAMYDSIEAQPSLVSPVTITKIVEEKHLGLDPAEGAI